MVLKRKNGTTIGEGNMPYKNMPKKYWPRMERCVKEVRQKGTGVNPYAVCYNTIMKKKR